MRVKLGDIAKIQTGLFANNFTDGDIVYLQAKHFSDDGTLRHNLNPDLKSTNIDTKHILHPGDVLFAAKGRNFASAYQKSWPPSVASTSFFVLRLVSNTILPEYLEWFLNHPNTKDFLQTKAIGTSLVSITKSVLQDLEIDVPEIKTQKKVLQIALLRIREKKLKQKIDSLREQYIQQKILKAIK